MVHDTRHAAAIVFNQLYEHVGNLGDPCVYCGVLSSGWDHVPPLHFVGRLTADVRTRYHLRLLPACTECNCWLSGNVKTTLVERRAYVRQRLQRKYARLLQIPDWHEAELAQLSPKLQFDIRSKLRAAAYIRQRIRFHTDGP
jgi:hypothetical protein